MPARRLVKHIKQIFITGLVILSEFEAELDKNEDLADRPISVRVCRRCGKAINKVKNRVQLRIIQGGQTSKNRREDV